MGETMTFRICVIGDFDVGKTSMILRYSENKFLGSDEERKVENQFDTKTKLIKIDNQDVKVVLCDTAGQERFT
jgi:small GTP-binding protein